MKVKILKVQVQVIYHMQVLVQNALRKLKGKKGKQFLQEKRNIIISFIEKIKTLESI